MKKLTKIQREVLEAAVRHMDNSNVTQPIHCDFRHRESIEEFGPAYAFYNRQMFKLFDAGVLVRNEEVGCYANVADYDVARSVLKSGTY